MMSFFFDIAVASFVGAILLLMCMAVFRSRRGNSSRSERIGQQSHAPVQLPSSLKELTPGLLTFALQREGTINFRTSVRGFESRRLSGGVGHGQVALVHLKYKTRGRYRQRAPPTFVVVKLMNGAAAVAGGGPAAALSAAVQSYDIECAFYMHVAKHLSAGVHLPRLYFVHRDASSQRFFVLMEDLTGKTMGSLEHGFSGRQAAACLRSLASVHVSYWKNDAALNEAVSQGHIWPQGGYWMGRKEMQFANEQCRSAASDPSVGRQPSPAATPPISSPGLSLAQLVARSFDQPLRARLDPWLSRFAAAVGSLERERELVSRVHRLRPRTLVHGDYKFSNVMLERPDPDEEGDHGAQTGADPADDWFAGSSVSSAPPQQSPLIIGSVCYPIDWQWVGVGSPSLDVAYFMATSVDRRVLMGSGPQDNRQQSRSPDTALLRQYHHCLLTNNTSESKYPFATFLEQYQLNFVYFAVFLVRSKYACMTVADFDRNARDGVDGLHVRSMEHASAWLLRQATHYALNIADCK